MLVDLFILLFIGVAAYRSRRSGFVRQFFGTVGFFGGLLLGRLVEPHIINLVSSSGSRIIVAAICMLGFALVFLTLGELLGLKLKLRLLRIKTKYVNRIDNSFGVVLTVATLVFSFWLLAAVLTSLPDNGFQNAIKQSRIIAGLNRVLPPAPTIIADLGSLIDPNGFPDVFVGNEPIPRGNVNLPELGEFEEVVNNTKESVVRLEGQGCGGIVTGSGFVVRDQLIATNAHVVAGIKKLFVQDTNGNHRGEVVWFDPNLDFAVVRVKNLSGKPLDFNTDKVEHGTPAVVLGYPGDGDFDAKAAAILDQIKASGRDIYGKGHTLRDVYEVKASIIPGNSGGPVIGVDGRVIGVIFAESTTYQNTGYAITASKASQEVSEAANRTKPVDTGQCTK